MSSDWLAGTISCKRANIDHLGSYNCPKKYRTLITHANISQFIFFSNSLYIHKIPRIAAEVKEEYTYSTRSNIEDSHV